MRVYGSGGLAYRVFGTVRFTCLVLIVLVETLAKIPQERVPSLAWVVQFAVTWKWISTISLAAIGALADRLVASRGDPVIWDKIHDEMDQLQRKAFKRRAQGEPDAHHRATLYRWVKYQRWLCMPLWWRGQGWLVPVERSGHMTRECRSQWRASDRPEECTGIAGLAWGLSGVVHKADLPDLSNNPTLKTMTKYAEETGVDAEWLKREQKKGHCRSRSFCAIQVRARQRPWGVIVLDSRSPDALPDSALKAFAGSSKKLNWLLERV